MQLNNKAMIFVKTSTTTIIAKLIYYKINFTGDPHEAPCPWGHKLDRNPLGQLIACDYFDYKGGCGEKAACFYKASDSQPPDDAQAVVEPTATGVCCKWE